MAERDAQVAIPLAILLMAATAATDLSVAPTAAVASLYLVPVLVAMWSGRERFVRTLAGSCVALVVLGAVLPGGDDGRLAALVSRGVVAVAILITSSLGRRRLRDEAELRLAKETTSATLSSIADAVITSDGGGRVTFLNPSAQDLTGFTQDEARGRPVAEVVRLSDIPEIVEREEGSLGLARLDTPDGRVRIVDQSRAPIADVSGEGAGQVILLRDVTARHSYQDAIRALAYADGLTGLPNRHAFGERLDLELAHARRDQARLAVLFIDLDGLKRVNDRHGHLAGDALIKGAAQRIKSALREADTVSRLGGDEFTVIAPRIHGAADASRVAMRILVALRSPIRFGDLDLAASASIGIALFPEDAGEAATLVERADAAMYAAKQRGGRQWQFAGAAGAAPATA